MESRKYQLQTQIIEALKANDSNLYSLLKSQWAHRYGVESLEELENLDLNQLTQDSTKASDIKCDQSQEPLLKSDEPISLIDNKNEVFRTQSYEIVNRENHGEKPINPIHENNNQQIIQDLIPLPPKPRYGYLKKWLLRS